MRGRFGEKCYYIIFYIYSMQEATAAAISVTVPGKHAVPVDARWNVGLPPLPAPGDTPEELFDQRRISVTELDASHLLLEEARVCSYCAALPAAVRVPHRMLDCPKRKRCGARYPNPQALALRVPHRMLHCPKRRRCGARDPNPQANPSPKNPHAPAFAFAFAPGAAPPLRPVWSLKAGRSHPCCDSSPPYASCESLLRQLASLYIL